MVVQRKSERQNGAMPTIQVKNVPEETHQVLRRRAAEAHQSLQEYLRSRLIADAGRPTLDEVLDRIGHHSDGRAPLSDTTGVIRDDRDRR